MRLTRWKFVIRRFLRSITPLTWLIWLLLLSDLSAPGYLRFQLIVTEFDVRAFISEALEYAAND